MSDQNNYDTLGLDENASFEQIQEAKKRLLAQCEGDRKQKEGIEAAYDAILMERLRLRQEGKIKVPDRIRFAEEVPERPAVKANSSEAAKPAWLENFLDAPERNEVLLPAGVFGILAVLSLAGPSFALALGVGVSIYFLNRKEYRFWRAILLTVAGLAVGLTAGILIGQALGPQAEAMSGTNAALVTQQVAAVVTMAVLWLVTSFLR
ncbi:MAG: CPP1-like family protein [Cyanobacteria bacterium P01_C01_bin.120]|mgnify:CR=1 FL=1